MNKYFLISVVILISGIVFTNSCSKPTPPKAVVTVIGTDKNGNEIHQSGATVIVRADPDTHDEHGNVGHVRPDLDSDEGMYANGVTDGNGTISFDFKYEAILRVYAYVVPKKNDTLWGEGALILTEDETYSETVYLRYSIFNTKK